MCFVEQASSRPGQPSPVLSSLVHFNPALSTPVPLPLSSILYHNYYYTSNCRKYRNSTHNSQFPVSFLPFASIPLMPLTPLPSTAESFAPCFQPIVFLSTPSSQPPLLPFPLHPTTHQRHKVYAPLCNIFSSLPSLHINWRSTQVCCSLQQDITRVLLHISPCYFFTHPLSLAVQYICSSSLPLPPSPHSFLSFILI